MSVTWNPVDNDDIEVKKAFDTLSRSAYVLSGKDFPGSSTDFDRKVPESAFRKLSKFDSEIYSLINPLYTVITGRTTMQYSDSSVELLAADDFINLRRQLDIILDERYKSSNDFDDNYRDAKEASQMTLSMLRDDAREKQRNTEEVMQTLIRFRDRILESQWDIEFLIKQYNTGSVENKSDKKAPYLEVLNKDLADKLATFNNKVKEAQDKYSDWEKNAATTVGICSIKPLGWIVMGIQATKASDLRNDYDKLETLIAKNQQNQEEETQLIIFVNQLITQYAGIDQKMTEAIAAMKELSFLFSNQAECYDKIAASIPRMKPSTDMRARKQYIQSQMKVTVDRLRELKVVAEEFTRSFMNQVQL
ncbi:uncharacterized protein FIESC28_10109 [Fusarium coffeatum]|uniref:Uncharacterized protein n=1 Tax=Fusarium coffeatum TaxID=231269 RepID=A0A366QVM2_9HYPO|nr:uncharacterized protein FIESC28_10109 [Fusarium coffeatum]RBR08929.1 hypothetical protein FIESC28_10109 [Fusarium coffeatum]